MEDIKCKNCSPEPNKIIFVDDVKNPHCSECGRDINVPTKPMTKNNWREEFDKEFHLPLLQTDGDGGYDARPYIHHFIQNLLDQNREEVIKECLEALPKEKTEIEFRDELNAPPSDFTYGHAKGYMQALSLSRQNIKELTIKK